jgi:SAM-dependent methyltransferase
VVKKVLFIFSSYFWRGIEQMDDCEHWELLYQSKAPDEVSWFQPRAITSLQLIRESGIGLSASIIDVGGGASVLVDDLLAAGFTDLTLLDISASALATARNRLGERAARVRWMVADIRSAELPERSIDIWHDRAVFHFLTEAADRQAYSDLAWRSVRSGGHLVIGTFAEDGPAKCSGLTVVRYSPELLQLELGPGWSIETQVREEHQTPAGAVQKFLWCRFRKVDSE